MSAVLERKTSLSIEPYSDDYREQVLVLAREMHEESIVHRHIPLNEEKLIGQLKFSAQNPDVFVKLAVRNGEVLGGFFGVISTIYFSDERAAKDMAWFVKKGRRGSLAAVLLVAAFEAWGRQRGVKYFMLGQSTGVEVETTAALYEKLGYRAVGINTVKGV